ncbi:MAG: pyruvate decarboxylase [Burkholderiales bacterium]|nr:pyruvate decarboxylase [Burkholderiales bacterium]
MSAAPLRTSSHALLSVFAANGIDRVFLVPGESYLGILDALFDFPGIDVVTCRHEAGAGFMACADGRLTRRPAAVLVSRGPGASNAAIAVHTAQQDAIPLILVVGQVPTADLRREAFQEIDYGRMYGSIAKWVVEATAPEQLPELAFKAIRVATSGTPGPVVLVIPEDIQQQALAFDPTGWMAGDAVPALPQAAALAQLRTLLEDAQRPLLIAGGSFDRPGGREALCEFAHAWQLPVALSFRRQDLFHAHDPLHVGDLGLANPAHQMAALRDSDLIVALGTRMGDITTQSYTFPDLPRPRQRFVHCYPDPHFVGQHFVPDLALVCDPVLVAQSCLPARPPAAAGRAEWLERLRGIHQDIARWPDAVAGEGVEFGEVARALAERASPETIVCVDAGTFAAPVYRHFPFAFPQRLMAPLSGAMGYGVPAAIATQLRLPDASVVCLVGDGGFLMTGNEMIAAVERRLPILFVVSNNDCYGSIRLHQQRHYPGRTVGTSLTNPDFVQLARAFGVQAERVEHAQQVGPALERGLAHELPYLIEVASRLSGAPPRDM